MANKYKILIVDDDVDLVQLLSMRFKMAGFDTVSANTGLEAIEVVRDSKPNLILLDWNMPSGTGDSVMEFFKAKEIADHVPIVVLTALSEPWVEESAKSLGARDVLYKPFDTEKLIARISDILKKG